MTPLPRPVESPMKSPFDTPWTVTRLVAACPTGIGTGSVLAGSLMLRICAASSGEIPGWARR